MAEITKPNMSVLWANGGAILSPSNSKINEGWTAEIPPHQWENFAQNRQDRAIGYLYQRGIAEWDATTEYFIGKSLVLYQGTIYLAKTNNVNTLPTNTTAWSDIIADSVASGNPAGVVSAYAGSAAPAGYLLCQGQAVSRITYARLFAAISTTFGTGNGTTTFNVPDLRGEFVRGLDAGRGIDSGRTLGSSQSQSYQSHNHTASTNTTGQHGHTNTVSESGFHSHPLTILPDGSHQHNLTSIDNTGAAGGTDARDYVPEGDGGTVIGATATGGEHSHFVQMENDGLHTHSISITANGDHSHTVTVNSSGSAETRPRNVALNYIIKT